jgi:hypothetical protein
MREINLSSDDYRRINDIRQRDTASRKDVRTLLDIVLRACDLCVVCHAACSGYHCACCHQSVCDTHHKCSAATHHRVLCDPCTVSGHDCSYKGEPDEPGR